MLRIAINREDKTVLAPLAHGSKLLSLASEWFRAEDLQTLIGAREQILLGAEKSNLVMEHGPTATAKHFVSWDFE